jgi:predicted nucleic acid-binding protein
MIHLDTSFLIQAVAPRTREDARLRQWLADRTPLAVSTICWAEFLCGPIGDTNLLLLEQVLGEPVPFTRSDAERAANIFNSSGRNRGMMVDCMIAAVALGADATIATANLTHFRRFQSSGLRVESF